MFPQNLDPLMPTPVPPNVVPALQDFLANALTDARVRNEVFPFDRPTLWSQRPADQPAGLGGGTAGSGAIVPQIITASPYILTVILLAGFIGKAIPPKAGGVPYVKER